MNFYYWFFSLLFFSLFVRKGVILMFLSALHCYSNIPQCSTKKAITFHVLKAEQMSETHSKFITLYRCRWLKNHSVFFFIIFRNADAYEAKYRHLTCTGFHSFFASSLNFSNGTRSFSNKKNSERKKFPSHSQRWKLFDKVLNKYSTCSWCTIGNFCLLSAFQSWIRTLAATNGIHLFITRCHKMV